jgi:hypothetical protein
MCDLTLRMKDRREVYCDEFNGIRRCASDGSGGCLDER